jgi:hypothetical protein
MASFAGQQRDAMPLGPGDQALDQGFGQDVALGGKERGRRGDGGRLEDGLELGGFGRPNEAGGVAPPGQAADAGFQSGA